MIQLSQCFRIAFLIYYDFLLSFLFPADRTNEHSVTLQKHLLHDILLRFLYMMREE